MARPLKPDEEKRAKWPVLNVTPAEKEWISTAAAAQGMKVNRYILSALASTQIVQRKDWQDLVRLLCRVNDQLAEISNAARDRTTPFEAVRIDLDLLAIEHLLLARTMPWLVEPEDEAADTDRPGT